MYIPSKNKNQRSVLCITLASVLTLILLSIVTSCNLYNTERSTTREEVRGNPQQREIPFNDKAIDQVEKSTPDIPLYTGASKEQLTNGLEVLLLPNGSEKGKATLELLIEAPFPQNQFDTILLKTLSKAILLQGLYDKKNNSYHSLAAKGIWSSFKLVPDLYHHMISLKLSTGSGEADLDRVIKWIKLVLQFDEIRDEVFFDAINWQKSCLEQNPPSNLRGLEKNTSDRSIWTHLDNSVMIEKLRERITGLFIASNLKLIVVGDFDQEKVMRSLRNVFRDLPTSKPSKTERAGPGEPEGIIIQKVAQSIDLHSLSLLFPLPRLKVKNRNELKILLLRSLITLAVKERMKEVDLSGLPLQSISVGTQLPSTQVFLEIEGQAMNEAELLLLFSRLDEQITQLKLKSISEEEWSTYKKIFLKKAKSDLRNSNSRSNEKILEEARKYYLKGQPLLSPSQWYSYAKLTLPQLKKEELDKALRSILDESKRSLQVHYQGEPDALFEAKLEALISQNGQVDDPQPRKEQKAGEVDSPDFSSLERVEVIERKKMANDRLEWVVLENGIRFFCLKNEAQKDEIQFTAIAEGGWKDMANGLHSEAEYLPTLMNESISTSIRFEDQDFYHGKAITLKPFIDQHSHGWVGKSTPEDIEYLLQLFYISMDNSRGRRWQEMLDAYPHIIKNGEAEVGLLNTESFCSMQGQQSQSLKSTDLSSIDLDALQQDFFADAHRYRMVFAGNFNSLVLISRAQKYLGHLNRMDSVQEIKSNDHPTEGGINLLNIQDKCKSLAFKADMGWKDEELLALYAIADYLSLELEKQQLENGHWSWDYELLPARWKSGESFPLIVLIKDVHGSVSDLEQVVYHQLEKIRKGNIDPGSFKLVKSRLKHRFFADLNSNLYWLNQVIENVEEAKDIKLPGPTESEQFSVNLTPNLMTLYATLYLSEGSLINE